MRINSTWLNKNFKQKYYLFCKDSEFTIKKYNNSFGDVENKSYTSRIKILEI